MFECENIWYFLMFISLVCLQMCKEFVSRKIKKIVCNKLIMKFIIYRQVFSSMKDVSSNNFNEADFMWLWCEWSAEDELLFAFNSGISTSFEGKHGSIRYWLKAEMDKPWSFNHKTKKAFTVISPIDINRPEYQVQSKWNCRHQNWISW